MGYDTLKMGRYYDLMSCKDDESLVSVYYGVDAGNLLLCDYRSKLLRLSFLRELPKLYDVDVVLTVEDWLDYSSGSTLEEVALGDGWRDVCVVDGLSKVSAYRKAFDGVYSSYSGIFGGGSSSGDGFTRRYGVLHLILQVCDVCHEPFDVVLGWNLCKCLNIVSYCIARSDYENSNRNKIVY